MRQQLGSAGCRHSHSAVTVRVPSSPVQPGAGDHSFAHCPGTDNESGVLQGELPMALAW